MDGRIAQLHQPDDLVVREARHARAFKARVEMALDRVHIVGRDQLALLAGERRVVVEVDAGLEPHREGLEIGRDLGQRHRRVRPDAHRPRQKLEAIGRVEHVGNHRGGIEVGDLRRVEAALGDADRVAQHFRLANRGRRGVNARRTRRVPGAQAEHQRGGTQNGPQAQRSANRHERRSSWDHGGGPAGAGGHRTRVQARV